MRKTTGNDLAGTKGANGIWQRTISEFPLHRIYVEPFWGRGTLAKKKRPADRTIGVDVDPRALEDGREFGATMFEADAIEWLDAWFPSSGAPLIETPNGWDDWFVYLDPPYLGLGHQYYIRDLSEAEHAWLIRKFLDLPCRAALAGYRTDFHRQRLDGIRRLDLPTVNRAGQKVMESVWFNFDPPPAYHDVSKVGHGRRDRERISRRVRNWSNGLEEMTPQERQAVLEAVVGSYLDKTGDPGREILQRL